jgi:peptidoglycan biosynthesis protein MviN/MurJ (putative lipid II flippase)
VIALTLVIALEMLLYAERRVNQVLWRALAGLAVNAAVSAPLVVALGVEGRPLGVLAGVAVQLGLLLFLMRDDTRVAVLREPRTAAFAAGHALLVAAVVAAVFYGLGGPVTMEVAAVAAIVLAAAVTLLVLRAYDARQGGPGSIPARGAAHG